MLRQSWIVVLAASLAACGGRGEGGVDATAGSRPGGRTTVVPAPSGPNGAAPTTAEIASTAAPTATPAGATLTRLTEPGCCPLPFWSADSATVLFWSERDGEPPGVFGVDASGGAMSRVADMPVGVQRGGAFTSAMDGDTAVLTRTADGRTWRFDTGGEAALASHDGRRAAWGRETRRFVPGQSPPPLRHFVADLETGETREVSAPALYAFVDWTADGGWLMSRTDRQPEQPTLIRFAPDTGDVKPLFRGQRPRTLRPSRDGRWVAVTRTAEEDPAANGLYVLATDGSVEPRKVPLFGGYRWRDGERLLVLPLEPGEGSMRLVEVDAETGTIADLTDPATAPFRVAAGEWAVAPDGARVVFRSADDDAVWVMGLP